MITTPTLRADTPVRVPLYETRPSALESRKLELAEKARTEHRQFPTFEDGARTAMPFIANPNDHWRNGAQHARGNGIKLAFSKRLAYRRGEGYRTPETKLHFKALEGFCVSGKKMVELDETSSNFC